MLVLLLLFSIPPAIAAPPYFVANEGQSDAPFLFKTSIGNTTYYVTSSGLTIDIREYDTAGCRGGLSLRNPPIPPPITSTPVGADCIARPEPVRGHVLKMNFVNGNASPEIVGEEKLASYSNYFLGRDSCHWRGHVGHYQKVILREVWPGIDVELLAQPEGVETVYHVAPFADPSQIQIEYEGLDAPLSVDADGSLLLQTSLGMVKEKAPFAYQKDGRVQRNVETRYQIVSTSSYALAVLAYDRQEQLLIDPLLYGSYLGGTEPDYSDALTIDGSGHKIIVGETYGEQFPITPGAYREQQAGVMDIFVTKFSPDGDSLIFSTYIGAPWGSHAFDVSTSQEDEIAVVGSVSAPGLPLTSNAPDTVFQGQEGFIVVLASAGDAALLSSYIGGNASDPAYCAQWGTSGIIHVGGVTSSTDFPVTSDAMYSQPLGHGDIFFMTLDPFSGQIQYSSYYGGTEQDGLSGFYWENDHRVWLWGGTESADFPITETAVQVELNGAWDGYFTHVDLEPPAVLYGSYIGGSGTERVGYLELSQSNVVLTGYTGSEDFPTTPGVIDTLNPIDNFGDGFISIVNIDSGLLRSTYIGGNEESEFIGGMHVLLNGVVILGGLTYSNDFPVTPGAFDTVFNNNPSNPDGMDGFLVQVSANLTEVLYGTYIGGGGEEDWIKMSSENDSTYWLTGMTWSLDFPTTADAFDPWYSGSGDVFLIGLRLPVGLSSSGPTPAVPDYYSMSVYPNPFNPTTTISLSLSHRERVSFQVFDLLGRRVDGQEWGVLEAGEYRKTFDGAGLPSGVYVMRVQAGEQVKSGKLVMVR